MTAWIDWMLANGPLVIVGLLMLALLDLWFARHPEAVERLCDRVLR